MATTCDLKCYDLAEHFLADSELSADQRLDRTMSLACAIQQAIEDWMADEDVRVLEAAERDEERRSLKGYTDEERERI